MSATLDAPQVPFPQTMARFPRLRQSLLGAFDLCALEARLAQELEYDGPLDDPDRLQWHTHPQARGTIFHRWAAKLLDTLESIGQDALADTVECRYERCGARPNDDREEGDEGPDYQEGNTCPVCGIGTLARVPLTDLALSMLVDTLRQSDVADEDVVRVPQVHVKDLEWVVCKFAREQRFRIENYVGAEERYEATLEYPNPYGGTVRRTLSGQIDAWFLELDDDGVWHAQVIDYKDTWAIPGATTISAEGYWQQRFYAWLLMVLNPDIGRVTLREVYVRYRGGESGTDNHRAATIARSRLPIIEQQLSVVAEAFDRAWEAFEDLRAFEAEYREVGASDQALLERRQVLRRRVRALFAPSPGTHCFAGDTRLLTDRGPMTLREAAGRSLRVLNRHGQWEDATVRSFGAQPLVRITFDDGSAVRATPDHRWWRMEGNAHDGWRQTAERITTMELDRVPLVQSCARRLSEDGIRHGFVYGDGWRRPGRPSCIVRMMPQDEHMARYFPRARRRGDGHLYRGGLPLHYKDLPERPTPSYARGFIAGLLAADGHVDANGGVRIYCEGREKAELIAELAWQGGVAVTSVKLCTDKPSNLSPVGTLTRELMYVQLKPRTVPVLRPDHAARIRPQSQMRRMYREVVSIEPDGMEEVFCAVVPGSESFVLANGVATSNCNYCPLPHRCPIVDDVRVHGTVRTLEKAKQTAGELAVIKRAAKHREMALRGYLEAHRTAPVEKPTEDEAVKLRTYTDRPAGLPDGVELEHAKGRRAYALVEGTRKSRPDREVVEELLERARKGEKVDLDGLYREATSTTMRLVSPAVPVDDAPTPEVEEALRKSLARLEAIRAAS